MAGFLTTTATGIRLTRPNGTTRDLDVSALTPEIRDYATLHGLKQKCGDAAALEYVDIPGGGKRRPSVADKVAMIEGMMDRLESGNWFKSEREASGGDLYAALTSIPRFADKSTLATPAAFKAWVDSTAKALGVSPAKFRAGIERNADVAAKLAEIRESRGKGVDSDAILDTMG